MNVKELIKELEKVDPETKVMKIDSKDNHDEVAAVEVYYVDEDGQYIGTTEEDAILEMNDTLPKEVYAELGKNYFKVAVLTAGLN